MAKPENLFAIQERAQHNLPEIHRVTALAEGTVDVATRIERTETWFSEEPNTIATKIDHSTPYSPFPGPYAKFPLSQETDSPSLEAL